MAKIDVKAISASIKESIAEEVEAMLSTGRRAPHLAAIMVGDNPASKAYVGNKVRTCEELGFQSSLHHFPETVSQEELLQCIIQLNNDDGVDGFILQLPIPGHLNDRELLMAIEPSKDVDGFHPTNFGKMALGLPAFLPATPYGIILLLEHLDIDMSGKRVAILGRSDIVGTPMALLLSRKSKYGNATVTLLHSRSKDIQAELLRAEVIIAAIGIPKFVKADMVSPDAVIIDVGINRIADASSKSGHRLTGDVDYANVVKKARLITPVPGGVGLMTIVGLMKNTLKACNNASH